MIATDVNPIMGMAITSLAAGAFLLLELFGIRLPARLQWLIGLSLLVVFFWFLSRLVDTVSV
jgi:hypothetical protein